MLLITIHKLYVNVQVTLVNLVAGFGIMPGPRCRTALARHLQLMIFVPFVKQCTTVAGTLTPGDSDRDNQRFLQLR